jgi:hypothetical protein
MRKLLSKGYWAIFLLMVLFIILGQAVSYLAAPNSWNAFVALLPKYLSMVAFWGPLVAMVAGLFVWILLRLLGFTSLAQIRAESVQDNNPAPAIIFTGTLIAGILFLMLILRP